jgi:ABC-type transport system involved in multi-copper enzyme maturation permease subunit
MTTVTLGPGREQPVDLHQVPVSRLTLVELRKMFDTRSGFWLMASLVIAALLSTVATILFAPDADLTFYTFASAIGFPMTIILPMIAILAITGEWSQRSGLTTFTLVPRRHRVIAAKVIASVTVGVVAMLIALVFGVAGNLAGTAIAGTDLVWDVSVTHFLLIVLGSLLCLLTGTTLGILFRSSSVALVAYFVLSLVVPTLFGFLVASRERFEDLQPWLDSNYARAPLFDGTITGDQWAHVAVTAAIWLILPALIGLRLAMRSEVK